MSSAAPANGSRSSAPGRRASSAQQPARRARADRSRSPTASAGCCATAFLTSKMEKRLIDRRIRQMEQEGVIFRTGRNISVDGWSAACSTITRSSCFVGGRSGRSAPGDRGRGLSGIHFAMEFPHPQNKATPGTAEAEGRAEAERPAPPAACRRDRRRRYRSDRIGTSRSVRGGVGERSRIMPQPPVKEEQGAHPRPDWPMKLRTPTSHERCDARFRRRHQAGDRRGWRDRGAGLRRVEVNR